MIIEPYIGRNVEIVYKDSKGISTRRRVAVYSVRNGKVRVLDWGKKSFQTLAVSRIIAAAPFPRQNSGMELLFSFQVH
ncbi:hypothetical protein ACFOQM_14270 [Paenibacillus sp. GCM10012307]|uniref:Uncharacterized protein n=1 Tax=Paenibacillus roseus TaxID=2798579 RepID=A0A934J080_9BACL|nr:hypothetical protein [Paenibacillus roseus]MBJ6362447.1 hypothetical protein [Paenibacillus roseus]